MNRTALVFTTAFMLALSGCPEEPDPPFEGTNTTGELPELPTDTGAGDDAGPPPLCVGVDCTGLDDVCTRGECDEDTGECVAAPKPATTPCDDGDACTLSDSCRDGVCEGDAVVCDGTPCAPGVCDSSTGDCQNAPIANDEVCDDGSVCTTNTTCQDGECVGDATDCSGLDDACNRGECDDVAGCVTVALSDNTPCGEPAECVAALTCQSGVCEPVAVECTEAVGQCETGSCDVASGGCITTALDATTGCDDGDPCTQDDQCDGAGGCAGTPTMCAGGDQCNVASCDASGACVVTPVADSTGCDDADPCTVGDQCTGGACAGEALDCTLLAGPCRSGVCNATTGQCDFADANEGGDCDDDTVDCVDQTCVAGACTPAPRADCASCGANDDEFCTAGVCGPSVPERVIGFEDGMLPADAVTGGNAPWTAELGTGFSGQVAARAGAIGDGETSSLELSASTNKTSWIEFWVRTDSEAGQDELLFFVDGVEIDHWSGTTSWTFIRYPLYSFEILDAGVHTFEWRYAKDAAGSAGSDTAYVDAIRIANVAEPIDFEDGTFGPLVPSSARFVVDSSDAMFGTMAAKGASVPNGSSISLTWDVSVSRFAQLSFFYRLDAEAGDGLRVFIDSDPTPVFTALGTTPWSPNPFILLTPGEHSIEFRYSLDAAGQTGTDALWLDELSFGYDPCM